MAELCAVAGIGQTHYSARRDDVSIAGLVREAATRALEDAGMDWPDIEAVVIGKAPDMFEGVMMPELYLADALGCSGKPMLRVHTAGSVGGSTAIVAASLVQAGIHERVLTVSFEKQSESNAMWALTVKTPLQPSVVAGAGGYFAPLMRAYMHRSGAPDDTGIRVALKDRRNALKNPYAHLRDPNMTFEAIAGSPMLWDPIRLHEACPSSDGACAMVLTSERSVRKTSHKPAWIHATAMRSEPTQFAGREKVNPQAGRDCAADLYKKAGITESAQADRHGRDLRAVLVVRADVDGEPGLREGRRRLEDDLRGRHRARRRHADQLLRRRALVQPDRRLGHDPLRRGGDAGARPGGRAPGRRRKAGARPRLRRRLAVLLDVDRRDRKALTTMNRRAPLEARTSLPP